MHITNEFGGQTQAQISNNENNENEEEKEDDGNGWLGKGVIIQMQPMQSIEEEESGWLGKTITPKQAEEQRLEQQRQHEDLESLPSTSANFNNSIISRHSFRTHRGRLLFARYSSSMSRCKTPLTFSDRFLLEQHRLMSEAINRLDTKCKDFKTLLQFRTQLCIAGLIPIQAFMENVPPKIAKKVEQFFKALKWALEEEEEKVREIEKEGEIVKESDEEEEKSESEEEKSDSSEKEESEKESEY